MKKLTHYGKDVIYQLVDGSYRETLKLRRIEYTDLPFWGPKVLRYIENGQERFAVLDQNEVFVTDSIPLDLDWSILLQDCHAQLDGAEPAKLCTKASMILDLAYATVQPDGPEDLVSPFPSMEAVRSEIAKLGYTIEELREMDHHDIDPKLWKDLCES